MNKIEMITEVINIYDENADLRNRLARFSEGKADSATESHAVEILSDTDKKLIEIGKIELAKKVMYSYNNVQIKRNEDTEELEVETYKHWFAKSFKKDEVPADWSCDQIINLLEDTFHKLYEDKKDKALLEIKLEEQ